jgi:uncharacterized protein YggE
MHEEHKHIMGFLIVVVLALGFGLMAYSIHTAPQQAVSVSGTGAADKSTISVTGQADFDVDPDQAEMYIRVQTKDPTARTAQDSNSRIMATVKAALLKEGLDASEMETMNYNLWPQQKWDPVKQESVEDGYMVSHQLKVTTKNIDKIGSYLQTAVDNGANGLDSVQFSLTPAKKKDVNSEALAQASTSAKEKAEAIAAGMGVSLGGISSISESNVNYPYPIRYAMSEMAGGDMKSVPAPDLSPSKVTVSAQISVAYEIKQ